MEILKELNGNCLVLKLVGRLNSMTAPLFEEEIKAVDGVEKLVLDLEELDYISSAGLRVLLVAEKKMMAVGELVLINVQDAVREVLDITGFSSMLTIN